MSRKQPVLYTHIISPAGRAVELVAKALNLELEISEMNVYKGHHRNEEFKRLNPVQTIPTLDDNGFLLMDSHAIAIYLARRYGNGTELYSEDFEQQARINSVLFFESSILFARLRFCTDNLTVFRKGEIPEESLKRAADGLKLFEALLQTDYVVGDRLTIADLSCVASITTLHVMLQPSAADYPKTFAWIERIAKLPYYDEINVQGLKAAAQLMHTLKSQAGNK
ncbi:glutathione S-transferase 1-like [Anopheles ziemanni]|uniref:glutathione S-transferase 1-like n=1 Tax=Anopheles coustani TaxID=139045 RepID=UPI00265B46B3|nr:glutathione S-transferase 1-like [Anopheles coustani]XP_058168621.1 glutathione S-transferase 1-like [Anopheles ziemanni]